MAEKIKGMTFLCMVALRNKTVVHIFLPLIEKAVAVSVKKDCEIVATMVMRQHSSPLFSLLFCLSVISSEPCLGESKKSLPNVYKTFNVPGGNATLIYNGK